MLFKIFPQKISLFPLLFRSPSGLSHSFLSLSRSSSVGLSSLLCRSPLLSISFSVCLSSLFPLFLSHFSLSLTLSSSVCLSPLRLSLLSSLSLRPSLISSVLSVGLLSFCLSQYLSFIAALLLHLLPLFLSHFLPPSLCLYLNGKAVYQRAVFPTDQGPGAFLGS